MTSPSPSQAVSDAEYMRLATETAENIKELFDDPNEKIAKGAKLTFVLLVGMATRIKELTATEPTLHRYEAALEYIRDHDCHRDPGTDKWLPGEYSTYARAILRDEAPPQPTASERELRKALEPFSKMMDEYEAALTALQDIKEYSDEKMIACMIALGRLRRAREAYNSTTPSPAGERPDWQKLYADCAHTSDRDQELIAVTRETLRLAQSALRKQNQEDFYHNYGAAEREIDRALSLTMSDPQFERIGSRFDHLVEECAEVIKAVMKAERFGLDNYHPAHPEGERNWQAIWKEIRDLEKRIREVKNFLADREQHGHELDIRTSPS